jgi:hypothetical protein
VRLPRGLRPQPKRTPASSVGDRLRMMPAAGRRSLTAAVGAVAEAVEPGAGLPGHFDLGSLRPQQRRATSALGKGDGVPVVAAASGAVCPNVAPMLSLSSRLGVTAAQRGECTATWVDGSVAGYANRKLKSRSDRYTGGLGR